MRRGALALTLLLTLALALAACSGAAATPSPFVATPVPASSAGPDASPTPEIPGSPIAGVVTSIDSTGLDQVHGFTLQSMNGSTFTFVIGTLENGADFAPGHLTEHMAAAAPVLVYFRVVDGKLVVYRLEDAG
jgi:ABC-type proline/glycine betaine transport system substrate-binding protein